MERVSMYSHINKLYKEIKQNGDKAYKGELLEALKPLIIYSIKKYYNNIQMYDDLIQEGYEVVLTVLNNDDIKNGKHFLGYLKNALRFHYLDKYKEKEYTISLNQNLGDSENLEMIDLVEDDSLTQEELTIKQEEITLLKESLSILTERQKKVIMLFYIHKKPMKDIANKMNISYRTVVNTKATALDKLRSAIVIPIVGERP